MKITKVDITAFGKLKNVALQFGDGVNILQQQNGFGKSTMCAFVRAMLYGLGYTYKTTNGVRANDVTKYMPWDATGKFGGSMEISHQGTHYRIERFFGSTAKSESLQVVDLSTGKQLPIACPGEHFLGLTVDSYDRCTYLPQEQIELASNENFDQKLANLVQDSTIDYEKLQEKLRAYKKTLRHERGVGGEIPTLEKEIAQLQRNLATAQSQATERKQMAQQLVQAESALAQVTQEEQILNASIDTLQQQLFQSKPTQADVELTKKIDEVELQLAKVPSSLQQDYQQFHQLYAQKATLQSNRKQCLTWASVFAISAVVLVAIAILLAILEVYTFAIVSGVVAVALGLVYLTKLKGKCNKKPIDELTSQLMSIVSKYINPASKSLDELKDEFWAYHNNYQTMVSVRKALGQKPTSNGNETKFATQLAQAKEQLQQLVERKGQLAKTVHQLQYALSQPVASTLEIAEELLAKEQQLNEAKHKYLVATQTADLLAEAKESLSSAYIPELCARTEKLLNDVTNGNYKVVTDRTFAISLQENGQTKPLGAFSRGIKEITLLCFRIALAQLIYGKQTPLLIVDDAFVNFDEQNFARATTLLKQLSATTQIIYFTCHDRLGQL